MARAKRQAVGSGEQIEREGQERAMTTQGQASGAARFILQKRSALLAGLRLAPVAALLIGVATMAPAAAATSCYQPANIAVNGGRVANETTLDLSADGGVAVSSADGGNGNAAAGGPGGLFGTGGDAAAGNAGVAVAAANGGMIPSMTSTPATTAAPPWSSALAPRRATPGRGMWRSTAGRFPMRRP